MTNHRLQDNDLLKSVSSSKDTNDGVDDEVDDGKSSEL